MASFQDVSINEMQQVEGGFWGGVFAAVANTAGVVALCILL